MHRAVTYGILFDLSLSSVENKGLLRRFFFSENHSNIPDRWKKSDVETSDLYIALSLLVIYFLK